MKIVLHLVIAMPIVVIPAVVSAQVIITNDDDNVTDLDEFISNWQCSFTEDTCNLAWQLDEQCDAPYAYGNCLNMDCWDCDPCRIFDFDCSGCMATGQNDNTGCHWCPGDARCRSVPLGQDFWSLHPPWVTACPTAADWKQSCEAIHDDNVFSDPLYDALKWMYDMIHVESVWRRGITGAGIHVRINDVGLDATHAEFRDKFDSTRSCPGFVSDSTPDGSHGTAVASILAAGANNDECAVGIAPGVTMSACTFRSDFIEEELVELLASQLEGVDISHNSWGPTVCFNLEQVRRRLQGQPDNRCIFDPTHPSSPCNVCTSEGDGQSGLNQACAQSIVSYCSNYFEDDEVACAEFLDLFITCEYHTLSEQAHQSFLQGVVEGRQGKGIIYVFAGGNSNDEGAVTNTDGFIMSRFTIAVGGVDKAGKHAGYSTTGSSLHVVAPSGDLLSISNNIVAKSGGGCNQITAGSSFAGPVVSGIVALMLQVNPNLGWRDVQAILAETSQQADPTDSSWAINGGGLHHSYKYGFGIVDAAAAVDASQNWTNFGPEKQLTVQSGALELKIADDPTIPTIHTLSVDENESFVVESVEINLELQHASRGDLSIVLTSPAGTDSILLPGKRPENQQLGTNGTWKLMTVRNWNERPTGNWTLTILDESEGDQGDCANMLFEYLGENPWTKEIEMYSCLTMEEKALCVNGKVLDAEAVAEYADRGRDNRTAAEACCICGGGVEVSRVNVLLSWSLAIYGHDTDLKSDNNATNTDVDDSHNSTAEASTTFMNTTPPLINETAATDTSGGNMTANATNTTTGIGSSDNVTSYISSGSDPTTAPDDLVMVKETDASSTEQLEPAPKEGIIVGSDSSQTATAVSGGNVSFLRTAFLSCLKQVAMVIGLLA